MKLRVCMGVCLVAALLLGAMTGASAYQGFSADVIYNGTLTTQGKIFVSGDKMRLEKAGTTAITRMDQRVVWLLMPKEKMYIEQAFRPENIVPGPEPVAGEVERTLLGPDPVNSQPANKYLITVRMDGKRTSFLLWLAADSQLPLRVATEDGSWGEEFRNVTVEMPDAALFEIPAGYKKFSIGW